MTSVDANRRQRAAALRSATAVLRALFALCLSAACLVGHAQQLVIGRGSEPQSIDPHFTRAGPNQMTAMHVFDRLILTDENVRPIPGLAVSWEAEDELTWLIRLRAGVRFHDGRPFTADDVVYSLERAPRVPRSPASFAQSLSTLADIEVIDDLTLRLRTTQPSPQFIENIGTIYILSRAASEGAQSSDFNDPSVAVGTGPFRFVSWQPGDRLTLVRNDDYWGEISDFETVVMRFITTDAARVASLRSGSVDIIDLVSPADLPRLRSMSDINVFQVGSLRLVYLALNQREEMIRFTTADGRPLGENPLRDARVRRALSLLIDRRGLTDYILQGAGEPATQIVPAGVFGHAQSIPETRVDRDRAHALLAEAGYPDGFGVTVHGSGNRFVLDSEITQAIGQLLARGGIRVNRVEVRPYAAYTPKAAAGEYPIFLFSYGNTSGESSRGLSGLFHSYDAQRDLGTLNRSRYSNPAFDEVIDAALQTFDDTERERLLWRAAEIAFHEDTALIPLYFESAVWAARTGLEVLPRRDIRTLAMSVRIAR
ncbi:MAG: ABC transporter substrate-binding protein [Gammaproteobacteria bacterium]|nr:ABC transporter substrate-binding protein [Gammaproteobacteria bacterium]TVS07853.1 MAG: ABC transporter substrate-binding protein [Planctomycetaceae bacterium]